MKHIAVIIIACIFFIGCSKLDVFEKTASLPAQAWHYNFAPSFSFTVTDTLSAYNLFIVLRHTDAYEYNNIWLKVGTEAPGKPKTFQNINVVLANDATGWEGEGVDDIFEVRKNITPGPVPFKRAGTYTFSIEQIMRENPLKHILNIGIRVEKVRL